MIGATVSVPVKREGGEPVVPVSTIGEADLNEALTMAILELNRTDYSQGQGNHIKQINGYNQW